MSRKQSLAKKIAHTLMAMSIVYSGGMNIFFDKAYAAEATKNLTNSDYTFSKTGADGQNYNSGGITDGESVVFKGTVIEDITNEINVNVEGGKGGNDSPSHGEAVEGGKGGDGIARITIDENLSEVTLGDIKVSADGGAGGISGISSMHGIFDRAGNRI